MIKYRIAPSTQIRRTRTAQSAWFCLDASQSSPGIRRTSTSAKRGAAKSTIIKISFGEKTMIHLCTWKGRSAAPAIVPTAPCSSVRVEDTLSVNYVKKGPPLQGGPFLTSTWLG